MILFENNLQFVFEIVVVVSLVLKDLWGFVTGWVSFLDVYVFIYVHYGSLFSF